MVNSVSQTVLTLGLSPCFFVCSFLPLSHFSFCVYVCTHLCVTHWCIFTHMYHTETRVWHRCLHLLLSTLFFHLFIKVEHVCVLMGVVPAPWDMWRSEDTLWSPFDPSVYMWVPETELRLSGMCGMTRFLSEPGEFCLSWLSTKPTRSTLLCLPRKGVTDCTTLCLHTGAGDLNQVITLIRQSHDLLSHLPGPLLWRDLTCD